MKVLPQFVPTLVKFQLGLSLVSTLEDKLKAFDDFKYKQKSAWSNVISYGKVYVFWNLV